MYMYIILYWYRRKCEPQKLDKHYHQSCRAELGTAPLSLRTKWKSDISQFHNGILAPRAPTQKIKKEKKIWPFLTF